MKEEANRVYEGDNDSNSRDSLRFYHKLDLNNYKNLYNHENTNESDSSVFNTSEVNHHKGK